MQQTNVNNKTDINITFNNFQFLTTLKILMNNISF